MISKDRSDFIYTLEDDEVKCLTYIEKVDRKIREKNGSRNHPKNRHSDTG